MIRYYIMYIMLTFIYVFIHQFLFAHKNLSGSAENQMKTKNKLFRLDWGGKVGVLIKTICDKVQWSWWINHDGSETLKLHSGLHVTDGMKNCTCGCIFHHVPSLLFFCSCLIAPDWRTKWTNEPTPNIRMAEVGGNAHPFSFFFQVDL